MKSNFGDSSIVIHYIQQLLNETYNDNAIVNGEYYTTYDMNYGFAHFIAKYLDTMYPLIGQQAKKEYAENDGTVVRDITKPISVTNYFLAGNNQTRLQYSQVDQFITRNNTHYTIYDKDSLYNKIYNEYMTLARTIDEHGVVVGYKPTYRGKYTVKNDLPIFFDYDKDSDTYTLNENKIFTLTPWDIQKNICEIDNFIASYLLGQTIGPKSSMEDIYYAQKLLIRDREITKQEKGIWCPKGMEGTMYDFTETVQAYQAARVNKQSNVPLFVTGYFDIFTEGIALKEVGGMADDTIRGL